MALYQVYLLRAPDGEVLRASEVDCANDEDAILEGTRLGDADEVEIEVWERTRLVCWLPVLPLRRASAWQRTARFVARVGLSVGFASLGMDFVRWSVEALS
jgi:hypothetical protein